MCWDMPLEVGIATAYNSAVAFDAGFQEGSYATRKGCLHPVHNYPWMARFRQNFDSVAEPAAPLGEARLYDGLHPTSKGALGGIRAQGHHSYEPDMQRVGAVDPQYWRLPKQAAVAPPAYGT